MTPPTRKKSERRSDALSRERIVEAAVDLLDTAGESGLTFRALSERLATGPGAIYWHVAGKGELLAAATEHTVTTALAGGTDGPPEEIRAVALGLFDAIEGHPWLAAQLATQLSHHPSGPVALRVFETIGRQVYALDVPASSWFTATSALVHYILGAAGQHAANRMRARDLGPEADRDAYIDSVAQSWKQLDPGDHPFIRALADQGLDHDDRAQFLAGVDLIVAGMTDPLPFS
ncbi:TetR/AcrR family transcriptional regulator [Streptomyces sp. NBC_01298]|uniref:TetR/AcrR family transcriptional regulator n=1 Tax=Streptomyces sp. NBC_01298 TaxID=2903817 RepID=UPI002E100088|nr:TetR/AcrR family transcriptional regulator [Streptomyces sp. NBC_01298]